MTVDSELIKKVWNKHAENYDRKHNEYEDPTIWKEILETYLGDNKNQKVLDIGTGTGFLSLMVAELGYQSIGIDFAEQMIKEAKRIADEKELRIDYITSDWNKLPFDDHSIDVIINRCILWTIFDPTITLKEWKRVLKPSGKILSFLPENKIKKHCNHYEDEIEKKLPLKNMNSQQLSQILMENSFRNIEIIPLNNLKAGNLFEGWLLLIGKME